VIIRKLLEVLAGGKDDVGEIFNLETFTAQLAEKGCLFHWPFYFKAKFEDICYVGMARSSRIFLPCAAG
jgi:hypothetical protein